MNCVSCLGSRIIQEGGQLLYVHLAHLGRLPARHGVHMQGQALGKTETAECSNKSSDLEQGTSLCIYVTTMHWLKRQPGTSTELL